MMTMLLVTFLILFIPVLFLRASPEEAAAVLTGSGMIVFGFNYPVGFGITMAVVFLIIAVWIALSSAPRLATQMKPSASASSSSRPSLAGDFVMGCLNMGS